MPIRIDPLTLQQLIRPGLAVRTECDCRVDVTQDRIRLCVLSEDKTTYIDYTVPIPSSQSLTDQETGSFWLELERLEGFLNAGPTEAVTISLPAETPDATITLQSAGLSYRFPQLAEPAYGLFDGLSAEAVTTCSLHHDLFADAIQAANLVGGKMHLQLDPATHHVKFSATATRTGDAFSYPIPAEQISSIHGSSSSLTITINRLRDITPHIPDTDLASLQLTRNYLLYHVEHPMVGADLCVYAAKRRGMIRP